MAVIAAVAMAASGAAPTVAREARDGDVSLVRPFESAPPPKTGTMSFFKFRDLAQIDPRRPFGEDVNTQTLSIFGREDLIAATSDDYRANDCRPRTPVRGVLDAIVAGARRTSIVIVNESHERSAHRGFISDIVRRLRPLGYDTLAIETLANNPPGTPQKNLPTFVTQPALPYFVDEDGFYLSEATFGRLGRTAKALGYRLLPYEQTDHDHGPNLTQAQQIALREESQASSLAAFIRANPRAKLLVHVGYRHATEVPRPDGARWMATRLKAMTGMDPLTISQTTCRGGGAVTRLAMLPASEPKGTFDLVVDHPSEAFVHGRPRWRIAAGDRVVAIPSGLRPAAGWRVIEARPVGEPVASVPIDRVAIRADDTDVALMLPPGRYTLRSIDVTPVKKDEG